LASIFDRFLLILGAKLGSKIVAKSIQEVVEKTIEKRKAPRWPKKKKIAMIRPKVSSQWGSRVSPGG